MNLTQGTQKNAPSRHFRPKRATCRWRPGFVLLIAAGLGLSAAGNAAPLRVILQESDLSLSRPQTARLGTLALKAGEGVPWHTHDGIELAYVDSGKLIVSIAGQPDRVALQGTSILFPRGIAHRVHTPDDSGATLVINWVTDTGAPLSTPAPAPAAR